ncbi:hypothetical protein EVAR_88694_1 [Eumeta japonica]|uniref:Uncharacterized protein n=1 Tax=Eumeta variegata TaxID=151549 RepID=A0A4C1Y4Z7_EUMVA|nr:hypothetical protein EVAR_88694_1 [Eumeta japonica]
MYLNQATILPRSVVCFRWFLRKIYLCLLFRSAVARVKSGATEGRGPAYNLSIALVSRGLMLEVWTLTAGVFPPRPSVVGGAGRPARRAFGNTASAWAVAAGYGYVVTRAMALLRFRYLAAFTQ